MDAYDLLTENEMQSLENCKTERDWSAACDAIKGVRGGQYPHDWFMRVMISGARARIAAKWNGDSTLKVRAMRPEEVNLIRLDD